MDLNDDIVITPLKSHTSERSNDRPCCQSNCSICLSPMKTPAGSVITKCNHEFHFFCLQEAKLMKSECPLCRTVLTPLIGTNTPMEMPVEQQNIPRTERELMVERCTTAREAVAYQNRLREMRRQQERNGQQQQHADTLFQLAQLQLQQQQHTLMQQ